MYLVTVDVMHKPGAIHRVVGQVNEEECRVSFVLGMSVESSLGVLYFSAATEQDAEKCAAVLSRIGFSPLTIPVVAIRLVEGDETLKKVTEVLAGEGVNVEMCLVVPNSGRDAPQAIFVAGLMQVPFSRLKDKLRQSGFEVE